MEKTKWNKTAVLFITTHGSITITEEETADVNTLIVPEGITIKRASVSVPGECNIVSEDDVNDYVKIINKYMSELTSNRETTQDHAIQTIMLTIKKIGLEEVEGLTNKLKSLKGKPEFDEDEEGFVHNYNYGFKIDTINSGKEIINKKYERYDSKSSKNNWVIKVMNIKGQPDLLSFLKRQTRSENSIVTLREILYFLQSKGVENIVILDISCGTFFTTADEGFDRRTIRRLRRSIKKSFGGKRNKTVRFIKRKTKKNKKSKKI